MLFFDIFKNHPANDIALTFKGEETTYGEFRKKIDTYAAYFQSLGIKKGDKVGLLSQNSPEFLIAYFASIKIGAVIVPINFQLVAQEVAFIAKDSNMKLLLLRKPLDITLAFKEIGYNLPLGSYTFKELEENIEKIVDFKNKCPLTEVIMNENENSTIIYTSGTTGKPKGAMLTHKNLYANILSTLDSIPLSTHSAALCVLPMYHAFAWTVVVGAPLLQGGIVVIHEVFSIKDIIEDIKKYKIRLIAAVPPMVHYYVKHAPKDVMKEVHHFISGAAPLPLVLCEAFKENCGIPVQEGYGLSEASPVVTMNPIDKVKVGSIGPAISGVEVKIIDENGEIAKVGEVGELCAKGDNVMLGYWNLPEETSAALKDGWLHTGDLAYMDEDNYYFIVNRLKDLIITAGENIYPREVEEVIARIPGVHEVAVVGVPDKLRGQAVCAFLTLDESVEYTPKELRKAMLNKIATYKIPRYFFFLEILPKNATGKILKTELRDQAFAEVVNKVGKKK